MMRDRSSFRLFHGFICCGLVILVLGSSQLVGCSEPAVEPAGAARYAYAAYDGEGTLVAQGWLTLARVDSVTIAGSWRIEAAGGARDIGPQLGSGRLVGGIAGAGAPRMWIELRPEMADNNVQLRGVVDGDRFAGDWTWTTWSGITGRGTFEAVRRR